MRTKKNLAVTGSLSLPLPDDVGAIAVDTNIYKEYGFRVRSQPLVELTRVKELGVNWVIPEVWEHELLHHFLETTQKVIGLQRELSRVLEWADEEQVQLANKLSTTLVSETPSTLASKLLAEHFGRAKPVRLSTDWTVGPDVLKRYFSGAAPFEITGHKKSEFPDAFALATLANWAIQNNTRVLVVTRDAGCFRACEAFEVLVATKSLTEALSVLRASDAGRKAVVSQYESLIASELSDERSELREHLDAEIDKRLTDLDLEIEYEEESGLECEYEIANVSIDRIQPNTYGDGTVELRVLVQVWEN